MERKRTQLDLSQIPEFFHPLLDGSTVYDSSSSPEARVYFIDREDGFYLKTAPSGTLHTEAELTRYFFQKGLATEVLAYETAARDWLLTRRIAGEDCTHAAYLSQPERLCDLLAEQLRQLHDLDGSDCPVRNRTETYYETALHNYQSGICDASYFSNGTLSADELWKIVAEHRHLLRSDTLLHGDYCLPNVMLDRWRFKGFLDLGCGGVGDRHIDLFWGIWSLAFNLKTDAYRDRFLDAYGREAFEPEMLRVIAAFETFG